MQRIPREQRQILQRMKITVLFPNGWKSSQADFKCLLIEYILKLKAEELTKQRIWYHAYKAFYFYINYLFTYSLICRKQLSPESFFTKLFELAPPDLRYTGEQILYFQKQYPISSYGVILISKSKHSVLICKKDGKWMFPKGKIDFVGEDPIQCAIRQFYQQTGLDISHLLFDPNLCYQYPRGNESVVRLYIIKDVDQSKFKHFDCDPKQVDSAEWVEAYKIKSQLGMVYASRQSLNKIKDQYHVSMNWERSKPPFNQNKDTTLSWQKKN